MPTYSPAPFTLPAPRLPGGQVWVEVTWHPVSGSPHGTLAAYAAPAGGHIRLIPGAVPIVVADLALPGLTEQHADRLAELVNRQLRVGTWAELRCPGGRVEWVLHARRG